MNEQPAPLARLSALAAHLEAHRLDVELAASRLLVRNPEAPACCPEAGRDSLADAIGCRTRIEDGGALWFYTSWQEPIAEAHRITDALAVIKGYLAARS